MPAFWENDPIVEPVASADPSPAAPKATAKPFWDADPIDVPAPKESGDVSVGSVARSLFRGLPFVGTFRDELAAGARSLVGQDYDKALATERARDQAFSEQHPYLDTALGITGGVGGTALAAPALMGAGAGALAGRVALGLGARTLPGAVARGVGAGILQGAASGAGEGEDGINRLQGAATGAALGGVIGGAAPVVLDGVRRGATNAIRKVVGSGAAGPIDDLSSGARRYVEDISSDPARLSQQVADLDRLGPNAMLADVSPEWMMTARGAAARPGSRDTVVDALTTRDAAKNARLAADLDRSLGPAVVPSQVEADLAASRSAVDYSRPFANARAVDTSALADQLDANLVDLRGESRRAVERVRSWLNVPGTNQLDPNPGAVFQVRQEIDGLLAGEQNPKVVAHLTRIRGDVDRALAAAVPGIKDSDAKFQELARQSEGLQRGSQILHTGKTAIRPPELAQELAAAREPAGTFVGPSATPVRMRQGLRAEIDRVAGTAANDPIALQRVVKGQGDWARTNMEQVFGEEPARNALGAIDREVQFRNTHNRVTGGSDTAATAGFNDALERVEAPILGKGPQPDRTLTGTAVNAARWMGSVLVPDFGKARANQFASELAQWAVATGAPRDELVQALRAAGVRGQTTTRLIGIMTKSGLMGSREAPKLLESQRRDQPSR
jgi:hypothetical protein